MFRPDFPPRNGLSISCRRTGSLALLTAALATLAATAGCHEDTLVNNSGEDNAYIRMPGQTDNATKIASGDAFPLAAGDEWDMTVQNGNKQSDEKTIDSGTTTIGGLTGHVLESWQDGKFLREEVYGKDSSGDILLLAMGPKDALMVMSPPIPLFRQPVVDGAALAWDGLLHFKNSSSTASSLSRVSQRNTVHVAAGTFNAYRIDTMITTTMNSQPIAIPIKRWVVPGVGTVQEQMILLEGNSILSKQLQRPAIIKK